MAPDIDLRSRSPIVEISSGKVVGLTAGGVHAFKGIPYGAPTGGANRFLPPQKPAPWTGVYEALSYRGRSPQAPAAAQRPELLTVWGAIDTLPVGEDCLTLHVWTPRLDAGKRPVMVWLHGGAFSYGSANSPRYDSTHLARGHDVVVVAVNHRLNIFGHLDLSTAGGERFAQSGNAGVLDLVQALEWVRDNIGRFGGDPGNVTIFGQSGGGGKVCALMSMPQASGLFHKAIVQSGASVRFAERDRTARLADAVLRHLDIAPGNVAALQELPLEALQAAVGPAQAALPRPGLPLLDRYNFGPVIDGRVLPHQPLHASSDDVPLLVGDTKDEAAIFLAPDDRVWGREITEDELLKRVAAVAGEEAAPALVAYYRRRAPDATPTDWLISALTASNFGVRSIMLAEAKAAKARGPVWAYDFNWETPAFGGRLKSCHSVEVPFVFDTLHVIGEIHEKKGAQLLANRMSKTWATFARSGTCDWPTYDLRTRTTMQFDDTCGPLDDPDGEVRTLWEKVATR
jgi:para-nitrobenzyl esterase